MGALLVVGSVSLSIAFATVLAKSLLSLMLSAIPAIPAPKPEA